LRGDLVEFDGATSMAKQGPGVMADKGRAVTIPFKNADDFLKVAKMIGDENHMLNITRSFIDKAYFAGIMDVGGPAPKDMVREVVNKAYKSGTLSEEAYGHITGQHLGSICQLHIQSQLVSSRSCYI
jgi:hypothetical protein